MSRSPSFGKSDLSPLTEFLTIVGRVLRVVRNKDMSVRGVINLKK